MEGLRSLQIIRIRSRILAPKKNYDPSDPYPYLKHGLDSWFHSKFLLFILSCEETCFIFGYKYKDTGKLGIKLIV